MVHPGHMGSARGSDWLATEPVLIPRTKGPWGKNYLGLQTKMNIQVMCQTQATMFQVNQEKHPIIQNCATNITIPRCKTNAYYSDVNNVTLDTPLKHIQNTKKKLTYSRTIPWIFMLKDLKNLIWSEQLTNSYFGSLVLLFLSIKRLWDSLQIAPVHWGN